MILRLLGAIQFLTVVPVRGRTVPPGASAVFFPLVGLVLGAAGGWLLEMSRGYIPFSIAALLVLAFWTLLTGGLHEDGFADVADAFRAYRPAEKIFLILKDSRVGAHGAVALLFLVLVRWQALSSITVPAVPALAASFALSRAAIVGLLWTSAPAGSGSASAMSNSLGSVGAVLAIAQGAAFAVYLGGPAARFLLGGAMAIVLLARTYFVRRIGGVTGDCLGATQQLVETWCLVVLACPPCTL
jgi:adenosylcobinamide-GDP ribazoletransferase